MKRSFGAISIALNIALLGGFLFCLKPVRVSVMPKSEKKRQAPFPSKTIQIINVIDATNTSVSVANFQWRDIESEDYSTYIVNLRAIHCPEKTIFDIIFADIEKLFAERKKKLETEKTFWLAGDDFEKARLAKEKKLFDLSEEKRSLIKSLLDSDLDWEVMQDWYGEKELGVFCGFLLDSQAERSLSVAKKFVDRFENLEARAGGLLIPEDAEEKKKIYAEMRSSLGGIVSATDLEEGELRMICLVGSIFSKSDLNSKLTGSELRQIIQLKLRFDNPLEHEVFKYDGEDSAPEELSKQNFLTEVRKFLGEVRFKQYLRAHDPEFEQLCNLVEETGLRSETATAIFEVQSVAMLESLKIRDDGSLRRKDRRLQLEYIQQSTHDAIEQLLGDKTMVRYSTNGGGWLTDLAKP